MPAEAPGLLPLAWDVWRSGRCDAAGLAPHQQRRLGALVAWARTRSPAYRRLYRGLPQRVTDLHVLPPVRKPDLMAAFDDWVTDPAVTLAGVRRFLADPSLVGTWYLGRYLVLTTSGTTGEPAVVLLDPASWRVANVVLRLRVWQGHLSSTEVRRLLREGVRSAGLYVGGGHFGGAVMTEVVRRRGPWFARRVRLFSVLRPLPELVAELNDFRPTMLSGYPTAMALLGSEQAAGRLAIRPVLAAAAGEVVTPATRAAVEEQLGCRLLETYAASEAPPMALGCRAGWMHVNADWFLLEPVDADHRPVPPGVLSHTVLVTNLGNRVQPVIRYDLGDRVVERPDPCPCGNPLPAIRVEGRTNDVLALPGPSGTTVLVLPLAVATVVEGTAGVRRFQLVQTRPGVLTLHVEPLPGRVLEDVRARIEHRLREYLAGQGVPSLVVEHSSEPPRPDPRSGKLRQVFSRL